MYFLNKKGKQALDLSGNFIISHNERLVTARVKSAGPRDISNAEYIIVPEQGGFFKRLKATGHALRFIWGEHTGYKLEAIEEYHKRNV